MIRIASYILAILIVLGGFTWVHYQKASAYERYLTSRYQHAFDELVTSMSQIDSALQKSIYATSPNMASTICTEIFGKAMTAQMSLSILPFSASKLEQTTSFVSRVGDYAYALSRSTAQGNGYSEEERENLKKLSETATLLSQNLNALQVDMQQGHLTMGDLNQSAKAMDAAEENANGDTVGGSMRLIETEFPEIPTLIYDGPFSDHLTGVKPKVLENKEEVSEAQARKNAAEFLGMKESQLASAGKSEGEIPAYYFNLNRDQAEASITVTVSGGEVMTLLSAKQPDRATISQEDALKNAKRFLENHGYENMKESYYIVQDNIMTANFAYVQDDIICYNDLIKVSVAMDSGTVMGFEAKGYLTAHATRDMPQTKVSADAAREKVAEDLTVQSEKLALIPTAGKHEVICYEFQCTNDEEQNFIIYVNAVTGEQEKILILLQDENGTLTI